MLTFETNDPPPKSPSKGGIMICQLTQEFNHFGNIPTTKIPYLRLNDSFFTAYLLLSESKKDVRRRVNCGLQEF